MRNYIFLVVLFLGGCVSVATESPVTPPAVTGAELRQPLTRISETRLGMKEAEVKAIIGEQLIVGYKKNQGGLEPITLHQPHRVETVTVSGEEYKVDYYITAVKKADGVISDDELTPLTFKSGELVSKEPDFVFHLKSGQLP
ncbi:MAG: DUF3192 domain-containing protein [Candidatus Omnitrophica bacterium]|nr:DUF3192 domain-containing protein [Candidatus Omnitrophota bacterium]